ncbi:MAG: Uma2 family endonuclease [Planctomycetes bacterium]|nr:Uma2 family endonuclease [Planctomycetota bacterium]
MSTVILAGSGRIPGWVADLDSFRRWARSDEFPDSGWFSYLAGEVWADPSMETAGHNQARWKISFTVGGLIEAQGLGRFFLDRMRLVNVDADLSTEPDAMFISNKTLDAGGARLEHVEATLEVVGSPDMVLEVVSPSSGQKDTVFLRELYWKARIREYWLVDPRGLELHFDILRHADKGYALTRRYQGWLKSTVFGKSFRLTQRNDARGDRVFTLEVR